MSDKLKVVLYHAKWCGHCKTFAPEWAKFVSDNEDKYICKKIEESEDPEIMKQENIEGFPTIKIYELDNNAEEKCYTEIHEYIGKRTAKDLENFLSTFKRDKQSGGSPLIHMPLHVPNHIPLHMPSHIPLHVPFIPRNDLNYELLKYRKKYKKYKEECYELRKQLKKLQNK